MNASPILTAALREVLVNMLAGRQPADELQRSAEGAVEIANNTRANPPSADAPPGERYAAEIFEAVGAIYADAAETRRGLDIQREGVGQPKH